MADGVGMLRERQRSIFVHLLRRSHLLPPDVDERLRAAGGFAREELAMRLALNLRAHVSDSKQSQDGPDLTSVYLRRNSVSSSLSPIVLKLLTLETCPTSWTLRPGLGGRSRRSDRRTKQCQRRE